MKQYLTQYEKDLLEQVHDLEYHIRERNKHLIKANGYAPADPMAFDSNPTNRSVFSMSLLSKKKLLSKIGIARFAYVPKKQDCPGNRHRDHLYIIYWNKEQKQDMSNRWMYERHITIADAHKVKLLLGKTVKARILDHDDDGMVNILDEGLEDMKFPLFLFEEIKPANNPELIW